MNETTKDSCKDATQQAQPAPDPCEHHYEVIAHEESGGLKRCVKCRRLEAV